MTFFIILLLMILIVVFSYMAYRMVFYAPKRMNPEEYHLPRGEQYDAVSDAIQTSVNLMLSRPYEAVRITSHDGKELFARYYHTTDGAPLQIQFHGYKSSALVDFSGGSYLAIKLGHNALVVDQRSHGKSEGSSITFGVLERKDCLSWIHYARSRFGEDVKIILAGLSMGAATVLMATDLELPDNVVGVMADCPYSSPRAIIEKVGRDGHYPMKLMYPFVKLGALLFGHFHIEESSAVNAAGHTKLPILLLHGEDDRFVPCEMSREIHKAGASNTVLETFPGAGHGLCYLIDPMRYENATTAFINKILS